MKLRGQVPTGVSIARDDHGVPHIRSADLAGAYWGMGYCHALDRGMQMGLMRLLGQGRVSECLRATDESIEIDTFFRRMNWSGNTSSQIDELTADTRLLLDAYCNGVNAQLARRRRWEFRILGYQPEPWCVDDSLLMIRMTGYLTLAQSQGEVERLFVEMVQKGIDDERLEALFPGSTAGLDRDLLGRVQIGDRIVPDGLKWGGGAPRMMASNNWVVAPARSASGHALFANDPHLEVNRLPNVWVEQVIELPEDTIITANMPGLPGPVVGRKTKLAWGATYTFMDAVDSWVEECRGGKYRRGEAFESWTERKETILVKKGDPVEVVFFENHHGVLDADAGRDGFHLATRWAPAQSGAASLNAVTDLWEAQSAAELQQVLGLFETSWNWVMADAEGHIAYQMSGLSPIRHPDATGFAPMPGWDPEWDWQGFVPPESLPRCLDPESGVIVTANNDLNHLGETDPINMAMGDYRARRIEAVLTEGANDLSTFARLHMDTFSLQAEEMVAILGPLVGDSAIGASLKAWNFCYDTDSAAAVLFEEFYRELLVEMFGPTGLGDPVVEHLWDATGIFIDFYAHFDEVLTSHHSAWLGARTLESVYLAAFERVVDNGRSWGDVNHVVLENILMGGQFPRWAGFDIGPIGLPGGRATTHQGQTYESGGRRTSFAPSLRLMADMGEPHMHSSLAGGPSDRRFSKHYKSDLTRWTRGEYKELGRLEP